MNQVHYEVHWARSNRADIVTALRAGATEHTAREDAERECRALFGRTPHPEIVPIVVEVRRCP